jgi:hypothetical protein
VSLEAPPEWEAAIQDPNAAYHNAIARVLGDAAFNDSTNPQRNPVPAESGLTPDGTGWTLALTSITYPGWTIPGQGGANYGIDVNIWLACVLNG